MKKKVMFKQKLLRVSIVLIVLFTATVFFVSNSRVNNLVNKSISSKLDSISSLGLDIIESRYDGNWNVKDGKLFLGNTLINNNSGLLDAIYEKTGSHATIYQADIRVSTTLLNIDGERAIGTLAPDEVLENVLREGIPYNGTATILGEKFAVKYVPIKDTSDRVIGMWCVGMPKNHAISQGGQLRAMRASIVVISILCGILGCIILTLYSKKYLTDIDTLKVSFLESNSSINKTQQKVLTMSLILIGTFFLIWFTIQGFTIGNVVRNLEDNNINERLHASSELGYMLIDEIYKGDWSIQDNKLYKGSNFLNDNSMIVDRISYNTESYVTIFMGDTRISTNILRADGSRSVGTKTSDDIVWTVLKQGQIYTGETTIIDKKYITRYKPIKNSSDSVIGMWVIEFERRVAVNQIAGLRKVITQISLLAIFISFVTFLYLSVKMSSDISNFDVSLHTNI
ncbi:UNVERIFIED_CONTAM: single cache domain-containing protein [Acetivibrio alkalicellulosi]